MTPLLFFWTVLQHTPSWVWAVFALLVLLGLKQSRPSQVGPTRATLLPVAMLLLALPRPMGFSRQRLKAAPILGFQTDFLHNFHKIHRLVLECNFRFWS